MPHATTVRSSVAFRPQQCAQSAARYRTDLLSSTAPAVKLHLQQQKMQATMPAISATEMDTNTAMMTTLLLLPLLLFSSVLLVVCPLLPVGCAQHWLRSNKSHLASLTAFQVVQLARLQ